MHDDRLAERHVLVTGAAQGIGRGVAVRAARAGANVSIFDLDHDGAAETADEVRETGGRAYVEAVDVSDEGSVRDGVAAAVDVLGPIHGLVNNAGVQRAIPLLETTAEEWDFHHGVNARGTFFVAKHVGRHMVDASTEGAIVNVASVAAERPFAGQGAYAASKAAVIALTTVLAKELADDGVTVNAINPGTVDTPMVQSWLDEHAAAANRDPDDVLDDALDEHILDRMAGPEEIGNVAVLLLSAEGEWITGETINVDGGYTSN